MSERFVAGAHRLPQVRRESRTDSEQRHPLDARNRLCLLAILVQFPEWPNRESERRIRELSGRIQGSDGKVSLRPPATQPPTWALRSPVPQGDSCAKCPVSMSDGMSMIRKLRIYILPGRPSWPRLVTISIGVINMIREATAMTVRQNLGELLNEVQYRHDQVLITKAGKPVAAMVDIELFEKIRMLSDEFERLVGELGGAYRSVEPAAAHEEISEAIKVARRK